MLHVSSQIRSVMLIILICNVLLHVVLAPAACRRVQAMPCAAAVSWSSTLEVLPGFVRPQYRGWA